MNMQPISGDPVYINGLPVINNLSVAQQFAATLNQWEIITYSLYDSAAYPAAGVASLSFFTQPVGSGTGFGGGTKTQSDTNMTQAGVLSAGQAFIITGINVEFLPTVPSVTAQLPAVFGAQAAANIVNDAYLFRAHGNLQFQILQKPYLIEGPLMRFPSPNDFWVSGALADATSPAASSQSRLAFGRADGPSQILSPNNLLIIPTQSFNVTLNWPEGVIALPSSNPGRVYVRLEGALLRAAQ